MPTHRPSVVIVNNSRETFTSTNSGAIATCIWEICQVAEANGEQPTVISRPGEGTVNPWQHLILVPAPREHSPLVMRALRARRRLTGWARPDQSDYARRVSTELKRLSPDIIIVNNDPELAVDFSGRFPDSTVVHWFHNLELSGDRFQRRFALDQRIRSVAVSRYLARALELAYRMRPMSIATVHNGVNTARYSVERASSVTTIGFLGRIAVEKAPDLFLRACIRVAQTRSDFRVRVVGNTNWGSADGGPYGREVERLADQLSALGVEVERTGHLSRDRIPAALTESDIHVVPSRWDDPMPLTVLEGMASSQAVVAASTGGIPEMLYGVGVLFPRDDEEALAEALSELLDDPDERARLGTLARARASQMTWDRTWHGLIAAGGRA